MKAMKLEHGDVVQIDPEHDGIFGGCFMLVTEPKAFGAQGFVQVMPTAGAPGGRAYYRCAWEHMEYVGKAAWAPPEHDDE